MNRFLSIVTWLRAGYPNGVPQNDYLPILALLSRRLTADEIIEVARQLRHLPQPKFIDVGAGSLRITGQLPKPAEIERGAGQTHSAFGWPLDDPRDPEEIGTGGDRITILRALVIPPGPSALSLGGLDGVLDGRDAAMVPVPSSDLRERAADHHPARRRGDRR